MVRLDAASPVWSKQVKSRPDPTSHGKEFQLARTIAEKDIDTRRIQERLDAANIGDVVTYSELSGIIGRDVMSCYHLTRTARKALLATKKFFLAVPSVGFKRCDDPQKVAAGSSYLRRVRRACKKGAIITASVDDYDAMTKGDQTRHNAQLSLLGTMRAISTPAKLKAIESRVADSQEKLSMKDTIQAIAGGKKLTGKKRLNGTSQKLPVEVK